MGKCGGRSTWSVARQPSPGGHGARLILLTFLGQASHEGPGVSDMELGSSDCTRIPKCTGEVCRGDSPFLFSRALKHLAHNSFLEAAGGYEVISELMK